MCLLYQADIVKEKNIYSLTQLDPQTTAISLVPIQSGMGQFQPTRMPQGERSASFTMTELIHIAIGAIPPPNLELSLMNGGERPDVQHCSVFIDDSFGAI